MNRRWLAGAIGGAIATSALSSAPARADTPPSKAQCIETNTRGQDLRRDGKLAAARVAFQGCAAASCPTLVRNDCARRLDEIDTVQPSIVLVAKDGAGRDVSAVKVTVDGKLVTEKLDGAAALPVDPGEHVFTFTVPGQPTVKATFVLALGEKNRREQVVVGGGAPAASAAASTPAGAQDAHVTITSDPNATITVDGQVVGKGSFDGREAPGTHTVSVTETGMRPHTTTLDLVAGETRTLDVTLEREKHAPVWPWVVGGVALAAGAAVGGYFLFKPGDTNGPAPVGTLGTAYIRNSFGASR